jgi:hypothetical protein
MPHSLSHRLLAAIAVACVAVAVPCSAEAAERGALLKARHVAGLSRAQTSKLVGALGLPGARVRFGVDAYRVTYATVGVDGAPTKATGLVVLPRNRVHRLRTVSYAHGTMARRSDAPSRDLTGLAGGSALLFGGAGYATAAPDYLGLGYGPGRHPYMHLATEGSASLDMLRAAHDLGARRHLSLDGRTLVTGFSQGGVAAMALGRLLEQGADPALRLAALAPMSGPYDLENVELPALLAGRLDRVASNYYLSYVMRAWQPIYHVFDSPADVWRGSWGSRTGRLFDGRHDDVAIIGVLPHSLAGLFTTAFRARLADPDGGLLAGMRENDVACDWAPRAPTRIYAASADDQVAFANAEHCAADLRARGVAAPLHDVGKLDHFGSTVAATPQVLAWFDRLDP